jgi:hypothetical protein
MLIVVIFVHGVGIRSISLQFSKSWAKVTSDTRRWRLNLMLAVTIAALALLHFAETLIWAVPLSVRDIIPSMRDSYNYVLESYTTLGEGSVALPDRWRLLGPIIADQRVTHAAITETSGLVISWLTSRSARTSRYRRSSRPIARRSATNHGVASLEGARIT